MLVYYFIFFAVVASYFGLQGQKDPSKAQSVFLGTMIGLALFVGLGDMLGGYDRYIYADLFDDVADVVTRKMPLKSAAIFDLYSNEKGYGYYNVLISCITENRYIFILITTLIIYTLLFINILKYCRDYPFAVMMFLGLWFFFTFTYLREVMAATFVWLGVQYIAKRDLKKFLLIWFIAYTFHNSALVFLPMYFVPVRKFNKDDVIKVMVIMLLLGLTGIPTALFSAYGEVDATRVGGVSAQTGFRIAYMVEAGFFLALIYSKYETIPNRPLNIVLLNMALVFCAILLFFIKNENGGRLSWYYMIGVIATITYICSVRSFDQKNYVYLMIFVCFFLFNRIVTSWGVQLYPYKTFLTDGVRDGDIVWVEYEYDHGYDDNKLQRAPFRIVSPF